MASLRSSTLCLVATTTAAAAIAACSSGDKRDRPEPIPSVAAPPEPLVCAPVNPGAAPIRLLTRAQYNNTVADLLGDETAPADSFPPENKVLGFDNNASAHQANPLLVNELLTAAEGIAARAMLGSIDQFVPCAMDGQEPDECGPGFITEFGKLAFRRPLEQVELDAFVDLFERTRAADGFREAVQLVLEAMLQSPQFLYRPDSYTAVTPASGAIHMSPYQMASRLSYYLWNTMPDAELFAAAEAGGLQSEEEIETQARRMLAHDKARPVIIDFHRQWLGLDDFSGIVRDLDPRYAVYEDVLLDDLRISLEMFIDHTFWNGGTVEALFTSNTIFLNSALADVLRIPFLPDSSPGGPGEFAPVLADENQRTGLLTQPGLMALLAHSDQTSPVQRGVFVRETILCDHLPDPPPNVDTTPPDPDPNASTRDRFAEHTQDPNCASCHVLIDGVGFGFESYDHIGRYRAEENGIAVDVSGNVAGQGEDLITGPFVGARDLSLKFAQSMQVRDCIVTNWYRFATGRVETEADLCSIEQARVKFNETNGDLKELLIAMTLTDAFRYRPPEGHDQ